MSRRETDLLDKFEINYLFHMTHIDNLPAILKHGLYAHGNAHQKFDISDCIVNSRRARNEPIYHRPIHSYVPFYFNPKNHMLSKRRNIQDDIVILVLDRNLILSSGALFTDGNASSDSTGFSNNLNDLGGLDWKCIYTSGYYRGFEDGPRKRMSEVLVPDFVSVDNIQAIVCNNIDTQAKIDTILKSTMKSVIMHNLYF